MASQYPAKPELLHLDLGPPSTGLAIFSYITALQYLKSTSLPQPYLHTNVTCNFLPLCFRLFCSFKVQLKCCCLQESSRDPSPMDSAPPHQRSLLPAPAHGLSSMIYVQHGLRSTYIISSSQFGDCVLSFMFGTRCALCNYNTDYNLQIIHPIAILN